MAVSAVQVIETTGASQEEVFDFGADTPIDDGEYIYISGNPTGGSNWIVGFSNEASVTYAEIIAKTKLVEGWCMCDGEAWAAERFRMSKNPYRYLHFVSNSAVQDPIIVVHIERSNTAAPIQYQKAV